MPKLTPRLPEHNSSIFKELMAVATFTIQTARKELLTRADASLPPFIHIKCPSTHRTVEK